MAKRDNLIKQFVRKQKKGSGPRGDPFGSIGSLTPGQRIQRGRDANRITEDDPRFDPKTMGNKRYRSKGFMRQG